MLRNLSALILIPLAAASLSCAARAKVDLRYARALAAIQEAGLPASLRAGIEARQARFLELLAKVEADRAADPQAFALVDKSHSLGEDFVPADLESLDKGGLLVTREGLKLRRAARAALLAMSKAARAEGVKLVVGSAYRSYEYQKAVFVRTVRELGQAKAESLSAHPGLSQHQLGTALDFSPIDEAFAATKAGRWTAANAGRFGFSLSYPQGLSGITGYDSESWHFRFIGMSALALQDEFFGGVQEYLFLFLDRYR